MNRRILSAIIAVLGLIAIILAVCSATVWRPGATAEATLASAPAQNYVVTQPGVLNRIDSKVTVTATAASGDDQVFLAVGHSADVNAWLANDPYVSVTGMDSWDRLSATDVTTRCGDETAPAATAEATASDAPTAAPSTDANGCTVLEASGADPTNSDLWLTTASDKGSVALDLDAADTDLVVLAATDGASPAPSISLSWPRRVSTPWLVPGLVLGGLLLLVGVFLLLIDIQMRRADEQRRARSAERAARLARADGVTTAGIPQIGDPNRPLSRRELRDKERAEAAGEEWIDPRTGRVYLGGVEASEDPQAFEQHMYDGESPDGIGGAYGAVPESDAGGAAAYQTTQWDYRQTAQWESGGEAPLEGAGGSEAQGQGFSGPAYPDYGDQPGYGGQPGYEGQVGYGGQPGHGDQAGPQAQGFSGPAYPDYGDQPGYGGQPGYEGQVGYEGQPGHGDQAGPQAQDFSFPTQGWPAEHRRPRSADSDPPAGPESDEEHA